MTTSTAPCMMPAPVEAAHFSLSQINSFKLGIFIDPIGNPDLTAPQLAWAEIIEHALEQVPGSCVCVISSADICRRWMTSTPCGRPIRHHHAIDMRSLLEPFAFSTMRYQLAAFDPPEDLEAPSVYRDLAEKLGLDLLVMCTHDQLVDRATSGLKKLFIEQAPLPRLGHPRRLVLDTLGHRVGSTLERHASAIEALPLDQRELEFGRWILHDLQVHLACDQRYKRIQDFTDRLRRQGHRLAVLACQPPANVPCIGDYDPTDVRAVVARWAAELPDGWEGICTYHFGDQFRPGHEILLKDSFPNLHFLERDLAVDSTEILILNADALVTISSSTALTAVLFGKPAVTLGRSPFGAWTGSQVSELAQLEPLPESHRLKLLKFLCGNYCLPEGDFTDAGKILHLLQIVFSGAWERHCLVPQPLHMGRVQSIFHGIIDRTDAIENHVRALQKGALQPADSSE